MFEIPDLSLMSVPRSSNCEHSFFFSCLHTLLLLPSCFTLFLVILHVANYVMLHPFNCAPVLLMQHQIAEFQRQYDLLRLTCNSLIKCHSRAVADCAQNGETLCKYWILSVPVYITAWSSIILLCY